jgi:GNAT superfamily N-acetyltransferase
MTTSSPLYRLELEALEPAAQMLRRAFQNDPLWVALFPNPSRRAGTLLRFFRVGLRASILAGAAYAVDTAAHHPAGAAMWSMPGQPGLSLKKLLGSPQAIGQLASLFAGPFLLATVRGQKITRHFTSLQEKHCPGPHYHLENIGVLPEAQGQGLSSQLIRPILAQAEAAGLPAYTETMTPENVPIYLHFGFQLMEQLRIPDRGLQIWSLLRP